jgi:hypothetical protein
LHRFFSGHTAEEEAGPISEEAAEASGSFAELEGKSVSFILKNINVLDFFLKK